jgi:hypothetical protein
MEKLTIYHVGVKRWVFVDENPPYPIYEEIFQQLELFLDGPVEPDHDEDKKRANTRFAPTGKETVGSETHLV